MNMFCSLSNKTVYLFIFIGIDVLIGVGEFLDYLSMVFKIFYIDIEWSSFWVNII